MSSYMINRIGFWFVIALLLGSFVLGYMNNDNVMKAGAVALIALVAIFDRVYENNRLLLDVAGMMVETTESIRAMKWFHSMGVAHPEVIEEIVSMGAEPMCSCSRCSNVRQRVAAKHLGIDISELEGAGEEAEAEV